MKKMQKKFKSGAASFYIVAFSTLILLIVATSFAAIIISEITRTQNDDLAQSAYDSALAGIEDAKLAIYDYQNCKADESVSKDDANLDDEVVTCADILEYIEDIGNDSDGDIGKKCNMVANILDRPVKDNGVLIQETAVSGATDFVDNNMQQAYTCVQVQNILKDYTGTLSPSTQIKAIPVQFADLDNEAIKWVRVSWFNETDSKDVGYSYGNFPGSKVVFPKLGTNPVPTPPTLSLAVVQTAKSFTFNQFDTSEGNNTNRGMVYMVPTEGAKSGEPSTVSEEQKTYKFTTYNDTKKVNELSKTALADSNDKTKKNLPYAVNCVEDQEYACSAMIKLPDPVGHSASNPRSNDTTMIVVSLPYGTPSTTFKLEFYCGDGNNSIDDMDKLCYPSSSERYDAEDSRASLQNVQIKIDSTGRANDLYRRVEARLEAASDNSNLSIMGPLEILKGVGSGAGLEKKDAVKCEYDFGSTC